MRVWHVQYGTDCILSVVRIRTADMDRSIMLDNRSKDSYLLLHWQDRMSEEESTPGELEGEAEEEL